MNPSDTQSFALRQVAAMDRFFSDVDSHPLMGPLAKQRRETFLQQASEAAAVIAPVRTVLFFTGDPVLGTQGVDAQFAAQVMEHFQQMVKTQYAFSKHGRVSDRARQKSGQEARLLLTGTPRGSFGLELTSPPSEDMIQTVQLSDTLVTLNAAIKAAAEDDEAFESAVEGVTPRVFPRLKRFFKTLSDNRAGLRMRSGSLEFNLPTERLHAAAERVASLSSRQEEVTVSGTFRGVTLDTGKFDFTTEKGGLISGSTAAFVDENTAEGFMKFFNQPCHATLTKTTIVTRGKVREQFELNKLSE